MNITIDWPEELGHFVRQARLRRDLRQTALAELIGQTGPWLDRFEWGEYRTIDSAILAQLVRELRLDPMEVDGLTGSLIRDVRPGFRSYLLTSRYARVQALFADWLRAVRARYRQGLDRLRCGLLLTGALA